jgi:hypothetical protein
MSRSPSIDAMGLVQRRQQRAEPLGTPLQQIAVRREGFQHVEVRPRQDVPYLRQRKTELAVEHDLLEPQRFFPTVGAVPVAPAVRPQQTDTVVVMERAHADAGQNGQLPHRI